MNNYSNPPENDTPDWDELIGNTQAAKPKKQPKQDYTELATRISNEEGFDPNITLAVMKQESGQRNNAVSPKGASGLMQLMPATAKARGVRDLFDPEQNIRAGVQELKQHYKTNNGDLAKTLASYNWGSGNLQKKGLQNAPKETRDYIKNITSSLGKPINLSSTPEQDSTPDWDELVSGKASTVTTRPRRVTPVQRTSSVKPEQAQPTSKIDWSKIRIDDTKKLPAKTTIASKIASGEKVPSLEQQRAKTRDTNRESQGLTSRGQLMQALEYKQKQDLEARALNPALRSPEGMQDYNKAVQASRQGKRGSGIRPGDQSSNQLGEVDSSITNINDAINPYISNPNTPIIGDVPGQAVRGLTAGTLGSREEPSTLGGAIANVGGQFAPDIAAIGLTGGLGGVKSIASPILRSAVGTGLGLGLAQTGREAISGQLGSDQATKNILTKTAAGALGGGLSEVVPALGAGATIPQQIVNRGARTLYGTAGNLPFEGLNAIDSVSQGANPRDAFSQAIINSVLQAGAGEFVHGVADNARPNGIPMPGRAIGEQKLLNPSPLDPNYAPTQPLNYSDLASTKPLDYNDFANTIPLPAKQPRFNPILKGGLRPTEGLTPFERLTRPTPTEPIDLANKGTERLTSTQPDLQSIALPSTKPQSQALTDTLPFRPLEEVSPYTTQPMTPAERQAGFKPIETTKEMVLPEIQSPIDQLDSYTTQPMTQAEQLQQEQNMTDRRRVNLRNFFDQEGQTGYMDEQGKPLFMTPFDRDASNGGLPPLSPEFLLNQSANPTRQIPFERRRLENARIAQKQDFFGQDKIRLPELNNTYRLNPGQQTQDINLNPVPLDAPEYSVLERAGLIRPKRQIQQGETGTNQNINPNSGELTAILGNENTTQIQPSIVNQTGDTPIQGIGEEKGFSFREADTYPEPIQGAIPPRRPGQFDPYPTQKIVQNPLVANRPQKQLNPPPDQSSTAKFNIPGFKPTQSTKPIFKPPVNKPMIKEGKAFDPFAYDKNAPSVNLSRPPVTPEQAKIAYDFFKQLENPNEPLAVGKTGELDSPYFDKPIKYNPAIVDLDKILTSHDRYLNERPGFPKEFQPRDRKLSAQAFYGEQGIVPKFKPALLAGESISPAEGRPTIEGRRAEGQQRVISGNKRAMALDMIYNNYPEKVQAYKDYLVNNPPKGMTSEQVKEAIAKSGKPALVNMLKDMPDAELKRFANIANEPNVEEYSPLERARVDADSIDVNKISKIGSTGDLTAKENDSFVQDFINKIATPANRGKLYKNGELTQEGVRRVQNALFVKAFGDSPETLRILSDITESTSADYKNIANALAAKAPRIAQIKELGNASADYDISTDLMKSLNQYANLRKSGLSVDDYIKQQGLDELTSNQKQLLKLFDETKRSPNQLKQTLDTYLDTAQKEVKTNARQESMFGQLGEEKGQVLSDAVNKTVENRAKVKADKAAKKAAREKSLIDKLLSDQSGAIPIGSPLPSLKNLFQKLTSPTSPTSPITPPANQPNLSGIPTNQAVKEQPLLKTVSSTIKANMLLNPASALGDTIGTGGRLVVKNAISDTVRNAVDRQLAKIGQVHEDLNNPGQFIKTGENKRTFISGSAKETWNNFTAGAKGIKDAKNLVLKKGLTPTELQELLQHEIHTKGSSEKGLSLKGAKGLGLRAVDNYVNTVGRVRAAFDEPAYKYALKDATQAEIRVQAKNSGIPRAQLDTAVQQVKDFQDGKINQITVHPRLRLAAEEILSTAKTNAMYETLRDDNAFSKRFSEFKNKLWEGGKGSQAMAFLLDQASPFARTGTNIIRQASDMSVGGLYNIQKLTREGYKQGGFTLKQQASLAKSLGDVAMGSIVAGIAAYAGGKGYAIKNTFFNPLSGENKEERTLNEAANREGGSFQIPFTNRRSTTHILGTGKPIFEFGVAAQKLLSDPETSYEDKAKGIADQILNSALEHPATTATRDLALAFFGPDKADSLYRQAVTRATTLVMPKFLEQLSRAGGEKRKIDLETEGNIAERFAKDVYNNVRDRLPGRSNYNQPEYTALGDQNKYPSFAVVDPFRSKEERVTPVTKELTKQNVGLNPLQRNKAQGETPQEFAERSRDVGKLTNRQLTDLVTSKTYAELPKLRQSEKIFRDDKTLTDRGLKEEAIKSIEKGSHAGELTYPELSYLPSITSRIDKQIAPLLKNVKKDKLKRFANLGANVGGK